MDAVLTAMVEYKIGPGEQAKLLLQVHDELILECPEEAVAQTAELVRKEMETAVKLKVPLRVSVETGKRWGAFH